MGIRKNDFFAEQNTFKNREFLCVVREFVKTKNIYLMKMVRTSRNDGSMRTNGIKTQRSGLL